MTTWDPARAKSYAAWLKKQPSMLGRSTDFGAIRDMAVDAIEAACAEVERLDARIVDAGSAVSIARNQKVKAEAEAERCRANEKIAWKAVDSYATGAEYAWNRLREAEHLLSLALDVGRKVCSEYEDRLEYVATGAEHAASDRDAAWQEGTRLRAEIARLNGENIDLKAKLESERTNIRRSATGEGGKDG